MPPMERRGGAVGGGGPNSIGGGSSNNNNNNNHNNNNNNSRWMSLVQKWLEVLALILRIALWPVRRLGDTLLPPGEFDGLSPAVTEKAAQQFVTQLKSLSGQPHLVQRAFATTGFSTLKQEAIHSDALLFVFLHSPLHRHSNKMLQTLTSPPMLEFLTSNQDHVKALGSSIHTSQGHSLSSQLAASCYPVMALLQPASSGSSSSSSRTRAANSTTEGGGLKLVFKAEGPTLLRMTPAQIVPLLNGTLQRHLSVVAEQTARRIEREQEVELRRQQDEEYQEALRADQERERQQQEEREREERRVQELLEAEQQKVQKEQERLDDARKKLRAEPTSGGARVRFVLPSGKKLDRRFESDETVGSLRAFLILHFADTKENIRNFALSTNFPKKTYGNDDETLVDAQLAPQAVLMVQDLDA